MSADEMLVSFWSSDVYSSGLYFGVDRLAIFAVRGRGVIGAALCQIGREDFSVPAAAGPDFHHRHVGPDSEETQCFRRMAIAVARDIGGRPRRRLQRGFQRRIDMMRAVAGGSGLGAVGGSQGKCGENEGKVAAHVNSAPSVGSGTA